MEGIAIAVGICCALIFVFTAGFFIGIAVSGKLPEKKQVMSETDMQQDENSGKPSREEQLKNLMEYGGNMNGQ